VLCDSRYCWCVVRVGVDRCEAVVAWWNSCSEIGCDNAVDLSGVDTLEEGERGGVEDGWVIEGSHRLNDEVSVADEDTLCVELLRCHVIRLLCIGEHAGLQVIQDHLNVECLIGRDGGEVLRELELARGHVGLGDDIAHWDGVA